MNSKIRIYMISIFNYYNSRNILLHCHKEYKVKTRKLTILNN